MLLLVALLVALPGSYSSTSQDELQSTIVLSQEVLENLLVERAKCNETKENIRKVTDDIIFQLRSIHEELKTEVVSQILTAGLKGDLSDSLRMIMGDQSNNTLQTQTAKIQQLEGVTRQTRNNITSQDAEIRDLKTKLQQEEGKLSKQKEITQSKSEKVQEFEAQLRQEEKNQAQKQEIQQLSEEVRELKRQQVTENVRSTVVETPWERNETDQLPRDCSHHWRPGITESGRYTIFPVIGGSGVDVWCDMSVDGPWTVILSRSPQPLQENFARSWEEYKAGFGNALTEYWLGLDALHALTSRTPHLLKVQIQDTDGQYYDGGLGKFVVSNEDSQYEVSMEGGYGIGKLLIANNGNKFTTIDHDNDKSSPNCAMAEGGGGWWYGQGETDGWGSKCSLVNPTGKVATSDYWHVGVMGWLFIGKHEFISLRKVVMRIQPNWK